MREMNTFKFLRLSAFAATFVVGGVLWPAANASAKSCQFGTEGEFTASADVFTSTACIGEVSGNDSASLFNDEAYFGENTWVQNTKIDVLEEETDESKTYSFKDPDPSGILSASLGDDALSGTWSVSSWAGIEKAVLVLKGGKGFAAYLLDLAAGTEGKWSTQALTVGNDNQPALSHVALYTTPSVIPLPAAGWMLLSALGGLGLVARRRRKAS